MAMADAHPSSGLSGDSARTSLSLLGRVRAGDSLAWGRLVGLYRPLVYHWCRRADVLDADADDVVQEVFGVAAMRIESFRHDRPGDTFRGWLCGITRFKLLEFWRRHRDQPQATGGSALVRRLEQVADEEEASVADLSAVDDPADADEVSALFRRALALSPGRVRIANVDGVLASRGRWTVDARYRGGPGGFDDGGADGQEQGFAAGCCGRKWGT